MHERVPGGLSVSIVRLAALMAVAMLAACGGESAFMVHGPGGQGAPSGTGGDPGSGGDVTGSGGATAGTGGASGGATGAGGTNKGTGGRTTGTGGAGVSGTGGAGVSGTGGAGVSGTGGAGTGGAGTGGSGTGGAGTGGAGTGGAGTGGAGTGGAGGTGSGVVVVTVPFTAPNTGTFFNGSIAAGNAMALGGHTATFSLCVSMGTANPLLYELQGFATDSTNGQGTYGPVAALTALTTCPAMTAFNLSITSTTVINALGIHITSVTTDGATFGTVVLELDSISVSGDPVGPYLYMSGAQGFVVNSYQAVPGSTVTWQAFP